MPKGSLFRQMASLALWILVSFVAAALGGLASANAGGFYGELARPAWAPPPWLFGPVWTVLYILMGTAAWLVWRKVGLRSKNPALKLFLVQLALNALWTWLFFVWRLGALALGEIVVLWLLLLGTVLSFRKVSPVAAWLLVPYLLWVGFATALTYALWRGNPLLL
jgi:tryptophan-rich sensory protein